MWAQETYRMLNSQEIIMNINRHNGLYVIVTGAYMLEIATLLMEIKFFSANFY